MKKFSYISIITLFLICSNLFGAATSSSEDKHLYSRNKLLEKQNVQIVDAIDQNDKNLIIELVDAKKNVLEQVEFAYPLLNESIFFRQQITDMKNPIQVDVQHMHGISLQELHTIMHLLSSVQTIQEKEYKILTFLKNIPNKVDKPISMSTKKVSRLEWLKKECKNRELKRKLKYDPLLKTIAFIKVANYLDIPPVKSAGIKMLSDDLSMNYQHGIPVIKGDPYRKKYLDQLYSLPLDIQNKISHLFLMDKPHSGDLIKRFDHLFIEKTTNRIHTSEEFINFDWSDDSKYLFFTYNPFFFKFKTKSSPYGQWDSETDKTARINPNEYTFVEQKEDITTAKSPDGKYIAHFGKDNKIHLLNTETNILLEVFTYSNQLKKEIEKSKLLWSPDSKKLAIGNYNFMYKTWSDGVKVFFIIDLFKLKKELFLLPINQLFFLIELKEANSKASQFNTWYGTKIVFNQEQKEQFDSLPDSIKFLFKDKIAQFCPLGNYYY
jgi:hypothetical protein